MHASLKTVRCRWSENVSAVADPDFNDPTGQVGPALVGRAVVRPVLHLAARCDAVVVAVVLADWNQVDWNTGISCRPKHSAKVGMAAADGDWLDRPADDIARAEQISAQIVVKGNAG